MKYKIILTLCIYFFNNYNSNSQITITKDYFPIWTFHQDNINIHGLSIGLWTIDTKPKFTNTNGLKFEIIGFGFLAAPFLPHSPIVNSDSSLAELLKIPNSENINGLNLSTTGSLCNCLTNGISAGLVLQYQNQVNGLSASIVNLIQIQNGIMVAIVNEAHIVNGIQLGLLNKDIKTNGIQVGLYNNSLNLFGIQIGLWNVNQKRKLPFINWNFESD